MAYFFMPSLDMESLDIEPFDILSFFMPLFMPVVPLFIEPLSMEPFSMDPLVMPDLPILSCWLVVPCANAEPHMRVRTVVAIRIFFVTISIGENPNAISRLSSRRSYGTEIYISAKTETDTPGGR